MAILHVRHATTYRYRGAVSVGPHRLMLRPRDSHDLRLISFELACTPSAALTWSHDVFGNSLARATFDEPADTLTIISSIAVEHYASGWPVFPIAASAHQYPFAYTPDERVDLAALLSPQYPDPEGRMKSWAQAFLYGAQTDTLSLLKDLNTGISAWISYQSREDEHTQEPLETIARGWGTCRDFAVLFVEPRARSDSERGSYRAICTILARRSHPREAPDQLTLGGNLPSRRRLDRFRSYQSNTWRSQPHPHSGGAHDFPDIAHFRRIRRCA